MKPARKSATTAVFPQGPDTDSWETGVRLSYKNVADEPSFDPLRNARFGWQLVRRFVLFWGAGVAVDFIVGILALLTRSFAVLNAAAFVTSLLMIILLVLFVFLPVPGLLAQWSRLVPFAAPAAEDAFNHISQALNDHATPRDSLRPRRLSPPGEGRREYLELRRGVFAGVVSCFEHGHDLFVGWTFWMYLSPWRVGLMWLGRQFQDRTGRGNDMYQTLRYDSTKATIAALHACTLDGIDVAVRSINADAASQQGTSPVPVT